MGMYEFKKEDALDFARQFGFQVRTKGEELIFNRCPYCGENSRGDKEKFAINLKTGQFNCFRSSCKAKGNMITLSKDFNFELPGYADEYYNQRKRYREFSIPQRPVTKPKVIEYMAGRGISEDIVRKYELSVRKDNEDLMVFPFYDENNVLRLIKYRDMNYTEEKKKAGRAKEFSEKDCKPILFGMNHCNVENKTLIMTEGQIDSLSVAEAGFENAVSVPTGCNGFTWVPYCWDFLRRFDTLIVFGDYEKGKITLLEEMRIHFTGTVKHVREADYKDCKDANDILRKYGKDAIRAAVENAVPVLNPKIVSYSEVKSIDLSQRERISTGLPSLDKKIGGFFFGQLIILTGERGKGKSVLSSQFSSFAIKAGLPTFIYSGELATHEVKGWLEQQLAGNRYISKNSSVYGYTTYSVKTEARQRINEWNNACYLFDNAFISEDDEEGDVFTIVEEAIVQNGCKFIVIDNMMTAIEDDGQADLYRQQTKFVKELSKLAKRRNVIVLLIAHPKKPSGNATFSNDDILGSSNVTNLADTVLRYDHFKDDDQTERRIWILKNRLNGVTDSHGIKVYYQPSSRRVSEHSEIFDWEYGWEHEQDFTRFIEEDPDQEENPFEVM